MVLQHPAKTLGCFGDGGAVSTNSRDAYEKLLMLRNHGRDGAGYVSNWGYNGRLDNLQAAFLRIKLRSYAKSIERRRAIAQIYCDQLSDISGIDLPASPRDVSTAERYDIFQNFEIATDSRDELKSFLASQGIGTLIQWNGWFLNQFSDLVFSQTCPFGELFRQRICYS